MNKDIMCTDVVGLVGEPFEIETTSQFDTATLTFKVDKAKLGDVEFDNLLFLWYDEENQTFVELETILDEENSTVSVVTQHFSPYMIVDGVAWYQAWADSQKWYETWYEYNSDEENKIVDTIFVADLRSNCDELADSMQEDVVSYKNVMSEDDLTGIISTFDYGLSIYPLQYEDNASKLLQKTMLNSSELGNYFEEHKTFAFSFEPFSKNYYENVLNATVKTREHLIFFAFAELMEDFPYPFTNENGETVTYYSRMLNDSVADRQIVILLSDAPEDDYIFGTCDSKTDSTAYDYTQKIDNLVDNGVVLYTIGYGDKVNEEYLSYLAKYTGGKYYSLNDYAKIEDIYAEIRDSKPDLVTDTDNDGIADFFEMNGMYLPNASLIKTDYTNPDTDGDGLLDGEEIDTEMIQYNPGMPSDVVSNQRYFFLYCSYPDRVDSDGDELFDDEEYYLGTDLLDIDTDNDGLTDSSEVDLWYDPLNANPDGDSFNDRQERINGTNPFEYNLAFGETLLEFFWGGLVGDWDVPDNTEKLLGQMTFSFVPVVADARDYFANVFKNADSKMAIICLFGSISDAAPVIGVSVDTAKIAAKLGRFVVKHADDAPKICQAIAKCSDLLKNSDELYIALAKMLPAKTIEKLKETIKDTSNLTAEDYERLKDLLKTAGENTDEIVKGTKFKSFRAFKKFMGSPGENCDWHHLVEQCQSKSWRSNFKNIDINCPINVVATPKEVHEKISAFCSSKPPVAGRKTFRDWLNGKSFEEQLKYGCEVWEKYMKECGYNIDEWVD